MRLTYLPIILFLPFTQQVLLPECFIKFYMDFFKVTKAEAEIKIKETPLKDEDEDD